jgi:hypothetical protein
VKQHGLGADMTYSSRRARAHVKSRFEARSERLIRTLVAGCGGTAEVLEFYYWSREPGMIEMMRGIVAMPEETRAALEAFIALARDPKSIGANWTLHGALTLASPETSKTIALARYAAENDGEDSARMVN